MTWETMDAHGAVQGNPRRTVAPWDRLGIVLVILVGAILASAGAARVSPGPAVGDLPEGVVLDGVPEFLGPLYRVDRTERSDLVVLVTLPLARDRENWLRVVEACGAAEESDTLPDIEVCADRHPDLLDNRDWTYLSLWVVGNGEPMRLLAVARYGRILGETTAGRVFLSGLPGTREMLEGWKEALLFVIRQADPEVLEELHEEALQYAFLADDWSVYREWQQAYYHWDERPCADITPGRWECRTCCNERKIECGDGCEAFALKVGATGCAGAVLGCLVTEWAPAWRLCCSAAATVAGGLSRWGCNIMCRKNWNKCRDECNDKFK